MTLQTNLALVNSPIATKTQLGRDPNDGRVAFTHPALEGLENLSNTPLSEVLTISRVAGLATQLGMKDIIRWQPRLVGLDMKL